MLDLLNGIRVVSFNHFLLGPMGIQALGDLGADVISVESSRGRLAAALGRRQHLARWPERAAPVRQPQQAQHRHRSKSAKGKELALRLINGHVVAENFRPGVMENLGLRLRDP